MNEKLEKYETKLPATIDGLHAFILIGKERLKAQKAKIAAISHFPLAKTAKEAAISDAQDSAEILIDAEAKLGEMLKPLADPTASRAGRRQLPEGITHKESHYAKQIAAHPQVVEQAKTKAREEGEIITERAVLREIADHKEKILQENRPLNPILTGKYKTIVVDPPWPVKKILREERPIQDVWDYPKMSIEEIAALKIKELIHPEGSHIYLWTTHKFLPNSFSILESWGFKYQCLLTWRKNVGITPFSWMYSTEHVLFGKSGNLELLVKGKRLDFEGKVREHSRKPEEFYSLIKEVSPEPRIDIFSREERKGFKSVGNETKKF